jgi:hypothetical protein
MSRKEAEIMLNLGEKTALSSLTIIGAAIFAAVQAAEGFGLVPAGTAQELATVGKGLAGLLVVYGLRRAVSANGLRVFLDEPVEPEYQIQDEEGGPWRTVTAAEFEEAP